MGTILLNDKEVPELATIVHTSHARSKAKEMVDKLVELLPRQQFKLKVQAATGSKVLARGDQGRVQKLLKNQAKGKDRLKAIGDVEVSKDVFMKMHPWAQSSNGNVRMAKNANEI